MKTPSLISLTATLSALIIAFVGCSSSHSKKIDFEMPGTYQAMKYTTIDHSYEFWKPFKMGLSGVPCAYTMAKEIHELTWSKSQGEPLETNTIARPDKDHTYYLCAINETTPSGESGNWRYFDSKEIEFNFDLQKFSFKNDTAHRMLFITAVSVAKLGPKKESNDYPNGQDEDKTVSVARSSVYTGDNFNTRFYGNDLSATLKDAHRSKSVWDPNLANVTWVRLEITYNAVSHFYNLQLSFLDANGKAAAIYKEDEFNQTTPFQAYKLIRDLRYSQGIDVVNRVSDFVPNDAMIAGAIITDAVGKGLFSGEAIE